MESAALERLVALLGKYGELGGDELEDLYDLADDVYNAAKSKFLEALLDPKSETATRIIGMAIELLKKERRTFEEELLLVALLDIIATDAYDRLATE